MIGINEFKLYKNRDDVTGELFERLNCKDVNLNELIFDRVLKIKIYFSNGETYNLNHVSSFEFDLKKEINIVNDLFVPGIYNMQFELCSVDKIVINTLMVNLYNPEELLYGVTEFSDLKIFNIMGGFNTNSIMNITFRDKHEGLF